MSVIFGIKEDEQIILGGDRRESDFFNEFISDDLQKIVPINNKLCLATAGNKAIGMAILMSANNSGMSDTMNINELINIINDFYNKVPDSPINRLPFSCLIAGCDSNGNPCLMSGNVTNSIFSIQSVPMILHHPADTKLHSCNMILAKNYKLNHSIFVEQTIKEISEISKVVSPTGNKWVFDIKTKTGKLYSF